MLRNLIACGVKVVLDTNPSLMKEMLADKPFMIKTTPAELAALSGMPAGTKEECVQAALAIRDAGCEHVMILYDDADALFISADGAFESPLTHAEHFINTVGTGDSIVAGFLMNYLRTRDALDSFRFGASCGSATAYSKGLATREKIDAAYSNTEVTKIGG